MPTKRPPDREIGESLWRQSCSACHGRDGRGGGPAAAAVVGGVASLERQLPDDDDKLDPIVGLVQEGSGRMPAFSETIDRRDTRLVLLYIRDVLAGRQPPARVEAPEEATEEDADAR